MALLSMGESRWRMIRRVLRMKTFTYSDCRNQIRKDNENFLWLLENGFFTKLGVDRFAVTPKGREAAELGFYETK